jgi:PncC family amidohydrolase
VSSQVAEEMAYSVRRMPNASIGLSVTGIAGPSGGTLEKPVGLVYIGMDYGTTTLSKKYLFSGNRERIRVRAADAALDMLRRYLLDFLEKNK